MLMIASITSVCYSDLMRKMVVSALIVFGAVIIFSSSLLSELSFFLIAGKIPFTTMFIPATAMMIFWVLVVPISIIFRNSIVALFWIIVEVLGRIHQLHLNRRYRQVILAKQFAPLLHLYTIALLELPQSIAQSGSTEASTLRRRFATLQM